MDFLATLTDLPGSVTLQDLPADSPTRARAFLDANEPRSLIWNGGPLRPALLRSVAAAAIPATLINAQVDGIIAGTSRWIPGAAKAAVQAFDLILTADGATATRLRRGGVAPEKVRATGPILEDPIPLTYDANEFTVMVEAMQSRPLWHASHVTGSEVKDMAAAHLAASRKSHRMLLVLTPRDLDSGPEVATTLREAGLKTGLRSDGDDPDMDMQAYVTDLEGEIGLWSRVAPLTFIGGTLNGHGPAASPFEQIILGSAVVHGPHKSPHVARFDRLSSVEASREIRTASELGIAVGSLLSPEQTARMAFAGWEEITKSSDLINGLIEAAITHADTAQGRQR